MNAISRLTDYRNAGSLVYRIRQRRNLWLREMIEDCIHDPDHPRSSVSILDLGGEVAYWQAVGLDFLRYHRVHVTLLNHNAEYLPDNPDPNLFTVVIGDCCDLSRYSDQTFDIAHSNSVLEHLDNYRRMTRFAAEVRRVARWQYHQTPAFGFPIEPHFAVPFFHWLPEPARAWLLMRHALGAFPRADCMATALGHVQDVHLLTRRHLVALFPKSEIRHERIFGLTKSFVAIDR